MDGQRAHDLAREGEGRRSSRPAPVRIDAIRVIGYEWPFLDVEVDCGKGTYIRSIARDLGAKLGCGGLVQTLRRTRVGPFTAEQGIGLDADPASVKLLPMAAAVAGMPQVTLEPDDVRRLAATVSACRDELGCRGDGRVLDDGGELIGSATCGTVTSAS